MDKTITKHLPKAFLILGISAFTYGCSSQSISIPGSQLFGQQTSKNCIDKKTGKTIPGCLVGNKTASTKTTKREPLRLLADKPKEPVVTRKTVIKADKTAVTTTNTPATKTGVNASPAKMPTTTTSTAVTTTTDIQKPEGMTKPKPAPIVIPQTPVVRTIPKPAPVKVQAETTRRLTLSGSATFRTGSSSLSQAGKTKLSALARTLTSSGTTISRLLIEGHTDSSGSAAMNQALSLKRANAVADYLASQGIMRSSMETAGRGESSPIADNKTSAGRAQNRRVEITATGTRQTTR